MVYLIRGFRGEEEDLCATTIDLLGDMVHLLLARRLDEPGAHQLVDVPVDGRDVLAQDVRELGHGHVLPGEKVEYPLTVRFYCNPDRLGVIDDLDDGLQYRGIYPWIFSFLHLGANIESIRRSSSLDDTNLIITHFLWAHLQRRGGSAWRSVGLIGGSMICPLVRWDIRRPRVQIPPPTLHPSDAR